MILPTLYRVRQRFETRRVDDVETAARQALTMAGAIDWLPHGGTVAIAVGSRGIAGIGVIVAVVADAVRRAGAVPVVVPAMGSHAGGTAAGQRAQLEALGVRAETVGAEIRATMDTVRVGTTARGMPVMVDAVAASADAVVPVNRVKPHTLFDGPFGSGLAKLLLAGLGNRDGAQALHAAVPGASFESVVREALPLLLDALRVPFGVAVVEDANHDVAIVEAVPAEALLAREPELLALATAWMPRLPVAEIDLLIVDEMGKHISGQGMDPTVTGRKATGTGARPVVTRLFARDLAPGAGGNAHGVGQADATTRRLVDAADWPATWVNTFASGNLACGRVPPYFDCDRDAIEALLGTIGLRPARDARVVRVENTLALAVAEVSEACRSALAPPPDATIEAGPYAMRFDAAGNLPPLAP